MSQVTDYIADGICPKKIVTSVIPYTSRSKNGCNVHILAGPVVFATLTLAFDIVPGTNYGPITVEARTILKGVKTFAITNPGEVVLVIEPK